MKLIHITDTHFVPKGQTLYGRDPAVALGRCVEDINRTHSDADLCVITGDLTHWGEREAFEHLSEHLDKLQIPLRLLLGNHDDRETFRSVFHAQRADENGFIQSVDDFAKERFIYLDTNQAGTDVGWLCDKRMQWLELQLRSSADRDIYMFMHHPPCEIGIKVLDQIALAQKDAFAEILEPYRNQIRHIFFGHVHRPIAGSWRGIPISSLRAINHQVRLDFTESDIFYGNFEPPAYGIVFLGDDSIIVHTHDFMDESVVFDMENPPFEDWAVNPPRSSR